MTWDRVLRPTVDYVLRVRVDALCVFVLVEDCSAHEVGVEFQVVDSQVIQSPVVRVFLRGDGLDVETGSPRVYTANGPIAFTRALRRGARAWSFPTSVSVRDMLVA